MDVDHDDLAALPAASVIAALDEPDKGVCCEAEAELKSRGRDVLAELLVRVPSLSPTGQLHAIDVLTHLAAVESGALLITLLESNDDRVRQWAANALADLGVRDAVPAIQAAWAASKARGTPPDWAEPATLRRALAMLGARQPVFPPETLSLRQFIGELAVWPTKHLAEVITELAAHDQVVLGFTLWRLHDGRLYHESRPSLDVGLDLDRPWPHVVDESRDWALLEASDITTADDLYASIDWIDAEDV